MAVSTNFGSNTYPTNLKAPSVSAPLVLRPVGEPFGPNTPRVKPLTSDLIGGLHFSIEPEKVSLYQHASQDRDLVCGATALYLVHTVDDASPSRTVDEGFVTPQCKRVQCVYLQRGLH